MTQEFVVHKEDVLVLINVLAIQHLMDLEHFVINAVMDTLIL
jgi:hypothetical protein